MNAATILATVALWAAVAAAYFIASIPALVCLSLATLLVGGVRRAINRPWRERT